MCNCHDHDHDPNKTNLSRRDALRGGLMASAAGAAAVVGAGAAQAQENPYADPAEPALPPSDMKLDLSRAALVVTDPQIDFLHPEGAYGRAGQGADEIRQLPSRIRPVIQALRQAGAEG